MTENRLEYDRKIITPTKMKDGKMFIKKLLKQKKCNKRFWERASRDKGFAENREVFVFCHGQY